MFSITIISVNLVVKLLTSYRDDGDGFTDVVILCTPDDTLVEQNISSVLKNNLFLFVKPSSDTLI